MTSATWKGIIGQSFSPPDFNAYCHALQWGNWRPSFIVLHNTAIPSLAQRPNGFSVQNMKALEIYYRDIKKWKAGPHLFIDDHKIWVFTPLTTPGTHSPSWNKRSLGVEMLGDYANECFTCGRGAKVRSNTIAVLATLSSLLDLDPESLRMHKEDPLTTHNCPGSKVNKKDVINELKTLVPNRRQDRNASL
ncbi:MAG TPA: peptidoglycan recognition family protein [Flavisolibacter sp.]|nr:peptidoglycan recognition family protein [Flavisolibacter sp.]